MNSQSSGCWIELDLSPNNVPPNAICDIIMQNISSDTALFAGVRRKGSSLDRKIKIAPKTSMPLTVNADSNSKIEIYAEDMSNIRFKVNR